MNPGISGVPARAGGRERRVGALLEREREIARARALVDLVGSGEAGVLMFEGPTGIAPRSKRSLTDVGTRRRSGFHLTYWSNGGRVHRRTVA